MRKYQPIWEQIKTSNKVSIAAPIAMHKRIIQAVRKEKVKDVGWHLLLGEQGIRYKLKEKVEGKMITFYLVRNDPITTGNL